MCISEFNKSRDQSHEEMKRKADGSISKRPTKFSKRPVPKNNLIRQAKLIGAIGTRAPEVKNFDVLAT